MSLLFASLTASRRCPAVVLLLWMKRAVFTVCSWLLFLKVSASGTGSVVCVAGVGAAAAAVVNVEFVHFNCLYSMWKPRPSTYVSDCSMSLISGWRVAGKSKMPWKEFEKLTELFHALLAWHLVMESCLNRSVSPFMEMLPTGWTDVPGEKKKSKQAQGERSSIGASSRLTWFFFEVVRTVTRSLKGYHIFLTAGRAFQIEIMPIHLHLTITLDGLDSVWAARVRPVWTRIIRWSELTVSFALTIIAERTRW